MLDGQHVRPNEDDIATEELAKFGAAAVDGERCREPGSVGNTFRCRQAVVVEEFESLRVWAKTDLRAPPRGYIKRGSGTEMGLANHGVPYFPIIVGLASLLLSNRQETPVREPAISCQR